MFAIDTTDIQRFAVSSIGALILSTACVVAAVSPAKAAEANAPLTVGDWQAVVEQQIDRTLRVPPRSLDHRNFAAATVRIRFNADGSLGGASVAKSSNIRAIDKEALRVARTIAYPALPGGLRGRPQTVAMQLYFAQANNRDSYAKLRNKAKAMAEAAKGGRTNENTEVAALPSG